MKQIDITQCYDLVENIYLLTIMAAELAAIFKVVIQSNDFLPKHNQMVWLNWNS